MTSRIICADVIEGLRSIPDQSVQCVVTSPPYHGLRSYSVPPRQWGDGTESVLGEESTLELYVQHLVEIFGEMKRVMHPSGTFFLNMGDSHLHGGPQPSTGLHRANETPLPTKYKRKTSGSKKQLGMIPARVALALCDDGWILRQDNIWHKPGGMPESVKDRTTTAHEHVFHFVLQDKYYYDADAIAEPIAQSSWKRYRKVLENNEQYDPEKHKHGAGNNPSPMEVLTRGAARMLAKGTRNKRSVWRIPIQPFHGLHFACFPEKLVEICVKAGCPHGGTVLDPFCGSGRAGIAAQRLGRHFIGIDANRSYCEMAEHALHDTGYSRSGEIPERSMDTGAAD